jgi:hypothetical protein
MARAITPEIQVAEETGASLSQGTAGGHARTLELACSSWATTTGMDADSEDDKETAARHTLERGMTWAPEGPIWRTREGGVNGSR